MKIKLLFIFLLLMQYKIFAQIISKQNLEIVCREQHCSLQKADSILRNCAYIHFDTLVHNFDTITEGPQAKYNFEFTNIGSETLILQNVQTSDGGSSAEWPKQPILPGKSQKTLAVYNTQGKHDFFTKSISVKSNAYNGSLVLLIKGFVKQKK